MTDRFEEAVRDAVQGLPSASGDTPTYHDAWQRGRRRRLIKRSALAAAGVVVVIAALTVNLGRLPGSGTTEVDDLATGFEAATSVIEPTPLATTPPLETPDPAAAASTAPALPIPTAVEPMPDTAGATASEPAPTSPPVQESAVVATPVLPEPTPTTPAPNPTPTTPAPEPTPVSESATAVPAPNPVETAQADPAATDPTEPGADGELPAETDPNPAAGTAAQQSPDPAVPDGSQALPQPAFTGPGPADAVILDEPTTGATIPCDLDGDLIADANCELLADYPCTGNGDVRPGFVAVDSNSDQVNDLCIGERITSCDTTSDGQGDTPCTIELLTPTE